MSNLAIILCDPLNASKRRYVPRIPNQKWNSVRHEVTALHGSGCKHKAILAYLDSKHGLKPTLSQLGSKMSEWRLFTYHTTGRCFIPPTPTDSVLQSSSRPLEIHRTYQPINKDATIRISIPHLQSSLPLYSNDEQGNLIPNWSAFLLRAAEGDSLAMKTICILAKSQRLKQTQNNYLLYQKVIEAVRTEICSSETLSLRMSIMVFYAILALAIQAGFINGQKFVCYGEGMTYNEPAIHLNAAGYMLGRINTQVHQGGCPETLKQLVDFFNVANYLLALSRCAQSEVAAWPLLMYHLIVQ